MIIHTRRQRILGVRSITSDGWESCGVCCPREGTAEGPAVTQLDPPTEVRGHQLIDVESLLAPLSSDAPCGEDLEYDLAFLELERASQGRPEQQFGDTIVPAEEADWGLVRRMALELFSRTMDLRVAVWLTNALIQTDGWPGFRDGLALVDGLIERYWADVHPQLDPEDDNDPTLRMNLIASLADPATTLAYLRNAPLVVSSVLGRISLRDLMIARGELELPADSDYPEPDPSIVEALFMTADQDRSLSISSAITDSAERLLSIEARLSGLIGPDSALDISALLFLVEQAERNVDSSLGVGEAPAIGLEPARGIAPRGPITSRDDVRRAIEDIREYYRQQEPSSPVPILLERAQRLIEKDFMEVLQDIASDGSSAAETLPGPQVDA